MQEDVMAKFLSQPYVIVETNVETEGKKIENPNEGLVKPGECVESDENSKIIDLITICD